MVHQPTWILCRQINQEKQQKNQGQQPNHSSITGGHLPGF
jgi:hypothetical protein